MTKTVLIGIMLPFVGTALGAGSVYFMKKGVSPSLRRALCGFAAGVMTAASVWSLLIPALESGPGGVGSFLPAGCGFAAGMLLLLLFDWAIPRIESDTLRGRFSPSGGKSTTMLVLAVTLHNFPEGLAVGVALAGAVEGDVTAAAATALAVGIAIQNFPEGAIVSLPLRAEGKSKPRAFSGGVLSGAVEPAGALLTLAASHFIAPAMPFLLSFAAGAMIYVVIEELVPEFAEGDGAHFGTALFTAGFAVMMALDVILG